MTAAELELLVQRAMHDQQPRAALLKRNDVLGLENAWLRLKLRQARKRNKAVTMKTIAALLVSSCTVLAQTNGVPAPAPDSPESFWKWAIGVAGVLVTGFVVYFIKKSKAPKS